MEMPTPYIISSPTSTSALMKTPTPNPIRQSETPASRASSLWENQESLSNIWGSQAQFTDESSHLFSLYLSHAEKHDKELAENWIAGADGILVFTGLFAATLATFVVDSYKSLLPDSGRNTVVLLAQISQQLSNGSQISAQASVPSFQPATSAVWVNALWFLSLVTSLFCALLATLQQSWARRYLRLTQPQRAIHTRARLRSFFAEGVERFHLPFAVEAIPALLHVSMFLFSTGLVISLFAVHRNIAIIVLVATIVGGLVYMTITVMPIIFHDSPYQSPLSALIWDVPRSAVKTLLSYIVSLLKRTGSIRKDNISSLYTRILKWKRRLSVTMAKAAEVTAANQDWSIDARALSWTLDRSDEESELEKFIAGIPRFMRSKAVDDPLGVLKAAMTGNRLRSDLAHSIMNLLVNASDRELLSNYKELPEPLRQWRRTICLEALYSLPHTIEQILRRVSTNLGKEKIKRLSASILESEESLDMALRFSQPRKRYRHLDEKFKRVIIAARCTATVIATRLAEKVSLSILQTKLKMKNPKNLDRNSFLLKNLNHFLDETVLKYIPVVDSDIFLSTVRIVKEELKLDSAAPELRDEFENLIRLIVGLASRPDLSVPIRKNVSELLSELASLRGPARPSPPRGDVHISIPQSPPPYPLMPHSATLPAVE